jgi:hypothetical protein
VPIAIAMRNLPCEQATGVPARESRIGFDSG